MLYNASYLRKCDILASNGLIGDVHDQYIDDRTWSMRYLVVDTGNWLPGRKVLIAPAAITNVDIKNNALQLNISKEQVEESPDISHDLPVSRQMEEEMSQRFGWPAYWEASVAGFAAPPMIPPFAPQEDADGKAGCLQPDGNPYLRSILEIEGYGISTTDGEIGAVEDVILDETGWVIRYLVIETGIWLSGRKVLVAPSWCNGIDWSKRVIQVDLSNASIETCPEYDPDMPISRKYEDEIHQHYRWDAYWSDA